MVAVNSRHTVCADNIHKSIQGLESTCKQLEGMDVPPTVIDQLKGQIEFLRMQEQEVRDIWQSILNVVENDAPDEQGMVVTSSRPNVQ